MAKSLDIRTYNLAEIDNNKLIRNSHLEEYPLNENANEDGIRDEVKSFLHTNPFLYNIKKPDYVITSIEEFYIDVKKETKAFGTVIRGSIYKDNNKIKYTKKAFKKWHQDFVANKDRILNPDDEKVQIKDAYVFKKIKFWYYLILILVFIFLALILFKPGLMWTSLENKNWFIKLNNGINMALSNKNFNLFTNISLILTIAGLLFATIYNRIVKEHRKFNVERFILYKDANKKVEREFKKKYKFARRYYVKNIRKDKFAYAPLSIDKTAIEQVDLKEIEAITEAFLNKAKNLKKQKKYFYFFKFLTIHGSFLSGIFIFGYVVYFIIKNIL
mgnify:CR=1 FL=1